MSELTLDVGYAGQKPERMTLTDLKRAIQTFETASPDVAKAAIIKATTVAGAVALLEAYYQEYDFKDEGMRRMWLGDLVGIYKDRADLWTATLDAVDWATVGRMASLGIKVQGAKVVVYDLLGRGPDKVMPTEHLFRAFLRKGVIKPEALNPIKLRQGLRSAEGVSVAGPVAIVW